MTRLLEIYPRWWRDRYGEEMRALLDIAPARRADRLDLLRGALDAWLHPPRPSHLPAVAAMLGGGLWTAAAAGVVFQPVPPDWPGYLVEVIPVVFAAVGFILVTVLGVALRAGDTGGRSTRLAAGLAVVGYGAWLVALGWTAFGEAHTVVLGATQAVAMVATTVVGIAAIRAGEDRIGPLVLLAAGALLIPWTLLWLAFGACWTAIGIVLLVDRDVARPSISA